MPVGPPGWMQSLAFKLRAEPFKTLTTVPPKSKIEILPHCVTRQTISSESGSVSRADTDTADLVTDTDPDPCTAAPRMAVPFGHFVAPSPCLSRYRIS